MKRNSAAVRIPPSPPSSSPTNFKRAQIKHHPPSKPKRGVAKGLTTSDNTSTTSYNSTDTLSDVNVKFSEQQQAEEPIYQNIKHQSQGISHDDDTDTLSDVPVQFSELRDSLSKSRESVSKSCDSLSKSCDTLSDVRISFSESHDDNVKSRDSLSGVPGIDLDPQPIYQNVERSVEDILDEEFLKMSMERAAAAEAAAAPRTTNYIDVTISRPIRILSVSNPEQISSATTLNYLSIGSMSAPLFEDTDPNCQDDDSDDDDEVYSLPRDGPRGRLRAAQEEYDSTSGSSTQLSSGSSLNSTPVSMKTPPTAPKSSLAPNCQDDDDDEVYSVPRDGPRGRASQAKYDSTSGSSSQLSSVSLKTPPITAPKSSLAPANNTIYKDPSAIFLNVSSDRINRSRSTGKLKILKLIQQTHLK